MHLRYIYWLTVGIVLMATIALPVHAKDKTDYSRLADDKLSARFAKAAAAEKPDYCKILSAMLDEMASRPQFAQKIATPKLLNALQCAISEARYKDAYALSGQLENLTGIAQTDENALILAIVAEEYPAAAARVVSMAGSTDGRAIATLDAQLFWQLSRELVRNKHSEIRLRMFRALADSPHLDRLEPSVRSGIARVAMTLDAENGVFSRAKMLSAELQGPYPFLELLANRKLEPLWPTLEEIAGPNLQKAADADVLVKAAAYQSNPEDRQAFQYYAHALHFAGRFEEAIALVQTFDHSPKAMLKATEDDAWAMNIEAYALDALGRRDEAEVIFDSISALTFEEERQSWLVNFVINRASRLVGLGQWQKGLDASMLAHEVTEKSGSPYAKMLVRKARICALVNLGRTPEAAPLLAESYDNRADTYATAAEAYLCAGDADKAAAIVLEALKDPDHRYDMAEQLQSKDFQIFYARDILPNLRDSLRARPEIDAAFTAIARDLPKRLIPGASLRRREISKGL
jgi:tetratricopeptide (TPR) repeat protein